MKKFFLAFLLLYFFNSCNYLDNKEIRNCDSNSFIEIVLSNGVEKINKAIDSTELYIRYLNESRYDKALAAFSSRYVLDTIKYNDYYAILPKNDSTTNIEATYTAYRINEYIDDIDKNSLVRILTSHSNSSAKDELCMENIIQIDLDYLGCYLTKDKEKTLNAVEYFKSHIREYPNSKRVKYLWANLLADVIKTDTCILIYKELIRQSYYEIPSYKRIINYYWNKIPDSAIYYAKELSSKFPEVCNLMKIISPTSSEDSSTILNECKKCYQSTSLKDSIKAKVFFVRRLLNLRMLEDVEKNTKMYMETNKELVLDDLKLWEHGEYNDIILRYYFIKKNFESFNLFLDTKVSNVEGPKIESELDLYNLIQKYYIEYINKNVTAEEFDSFYRKYFSKKNIKRRLQT